jgi:hypothetical protein
MVMYIVILGIISHPLPQNAMRSSHGAVEKAAAPLSPLLELGTGGLKLAVDELGLLVGAGAVLEVRRQDVEGADANGVATVADDVGLLGREVGDLAVVLCASC